MLPYYEPIIEPSFKLDRNLFWSNFYVSQREFISREHCHKQINGGNRSVYGYDISKHKIKDKRRLLRNMVNPQVGKHILDCTMGYEIKSEQGELF